MFFGVTSQDFGLSSIVAKGKVRKLALELQNHMHPNFKQHWMTGFKQHWMTGYSLITYPSAMPFCQVQCPCSTQDSQAMSTKAGTPYYVAPQARVNIFCNLAGLVFQHHEVRCCRETTITLVIFGVVESSCEELSGLVMKLCWVQFISE